MATYYVGQTAAGDGTGSSVANCSAIATFNAGTAPYDALDDDTVYLIGTITTEVVLVDNGTAGHPITIRGDSPGNAGVLSLLTLSSNSYIDFIGITTTSTAARHGLLVSWSNNINFTDCTFDGASQAFNSAVVIGTGVTLTYNIIFDGCIFKDSGTNCGLTINASTHDITVRNSQAFGNFDNGMQAYDSVGSPYTTSPYNIYFLNNLVHDNVENGIELGWGVDTSEIKYNYVYSNGPNSNGIIISGYETSVQNGNLIAYNIVGPHLYGIVVAANSTNNHIYNNTIIMTDAVDSYTGMWFQTGVGAGNEFKNNIVWSDKDTTGPLIIIASGLINSNVTSNHNIYYNSVAGADVFAAGGTPTYYDNIADFRTATGQDLAVDGSQWANPLFTNVAGGDYTILSFSPCISAGADVGLTMDYAGNPVTAGSIEIGAYEYNPSILSIKVPRGVYIV